MPIPPEEDIVRGICTNDWDGERLSASLFKGQNKSVSRLAIVPLAEHWDMFRQHLQKPPERLLRLIGEIDVGNLQQIGRGYQISVELTVEPDPLEWNPGHAVIPQRITRGLANKIIPELKFHEPPDGV